MSDFVDDRAAEDEEEEEHDKSGEEAEGKSEGGDRGDSEEVDSSEEDEGPNEYEADGFIVDDEEEEGEGLEDDEAEKRKKKKKKSKKRKSALVLEEEDYELLEENTGIRRVRPTQHRRIKKARDMAGAQHDTVEGLKEQLFGLEDDELEDDIEEPALGRTSKPAGRGEGVAAARGGAGLGRGREEARDHHGHDDGFDDEGFDEDDWLVHDDEEEGGPPGRRRRRRRAIMASMPGVDADAMEEAQEIFGDVSDLLAMYEQRKREAEEGLEPDEYGDLDEAELSDEEAAEELRIKREERRRLAAERKMREQLDPEAMARHFMLPTDEKIRDTDLPEREQLHRGVEPQNMDLDACAQWVWDHLVGEASVRSVARDALEDGAQEVEGPPPAWYGEPRWHYRDLRGEPTQELHGHRAFYVGRDKEGRKAWRHNSAAQEALRAAIRSVLFEIYEKHEEVPFIGMYRKELCGELLCTREEDEPGYTHREEPNFPRGAIQAKHRRARRWDILWAVHGLAQQWRELQRRKEARRAAYERAAQAAGDAGEEGAAAAAALSKCVELLQDVQNTENLDDVEAKFQLAMAGPTPEEAMSQLSMEERSTGAGGRRRPQKASAYALCRRAGLGECVAGLGISAAQFGENVDATYKRVDPQDPQVTPEEWAGRFVNTDAGFGDAEAVLKGMCLMAAAELAAEPAVRQWVRENYWEQAVLSTLPTPAGEAALDPFHPLGQVKRLANKPLRAFNNSDQFLRVLKAEKEGLIRVELGLPPDHSLLNELADLYCSGGSAALSQAWDGLRRRILEECLASHLLPALEREARGKLATQARAVVAQGAADKLWTYASQAPLQVRLVDEEDFVPDRRVMAAVYGPGKPAGWPTTFVMLDPAGNLVDFLHCPQLSGHIPRQRAAPMGEPYNMFSDPKKSQDAARLRSFIEDHKPHVIVLGASHPEARVLETDLKAIRDQILFDNPNFFIDLGTGDIATQLADESIAALWGASAAAKEELPASPDIVRTAIALGRQMLDPLALLASLCGQGREVLALKLHPLQSCLPEEEQLALVGRVLSTAVAQVGVDLNAVAASTWLQAPLQFVPGLGPRKAAALLRAVTRSGGYAESRNQVWRELGVMGNRVFRNCGAYLRVRPAVKGMANLDMEALDDTRVHPESYPHAIAIAQSAVAGGAGDESGDVAVENALAAPRDVESLDLEAYNEHLVGEGTDNKLPTLIDIQQEFVRPYGELRRELVALTDEQIFWLCSGESPDTLKPGRKVEARVRYVTEEEARCEVQGINGLEAVIRASGVTTSQERVDCRDYFKNGDTVVARVRDVDPGRGLIELTTRSKDLNDEAHWEKEYCHQEDKYYQVLSPEDLKRQEAERRRQQNKKNFIQRPIRHPLFKNVSMQDAAAQLLAAGNSGELGEAIIRPHAKGTHMLALTMRLPDDIVMHVDIKEGAKGSGAGSSHLALGTPLSVDIVHGKKTERYDDLDELAARYLEPIKSLLEKLVAHRKFRIGTWDVLQEALRQEKKRGDPRMAAYLLAADNNKPGLFYLGFIVSTNPHREYFTVTPDGYHFRQQDFPSVDHLIADWKRQPYGAKQQQAAARQAAPSAPPQQMAPPQPAAPYQQHYPPGGYQDYQQQYPQGDYGGYAPTNTYQEPGEPYQNGGQYGGYGGGAPPASYQQGWGPDPGWQQQGYEQQQYGAPPQWGGEGGPHGEPPPPPLPPHQQPPPPPPMQQTYEQQQQYGYYGR